MVGLYHGKSTYLSLKEAEKAIADLKAKYPSYDYITVSCDTDSTDKIGSAYKSIGMFSSGKIIFLKRVSGAKDKANIIEDICSFIEKSEEVKYENTNIIIWEDQKVASNTRYFKFFDKIKASHESPELNKRSFTTWAKSLIAQNGITADAETIYSLSERSNFEPERFFNEIEKVVLSGEKKLTLKSMEDSSTDSFEYQIWDFLDAINAGSQMKHVEKNSPDKQSPMASTILENLLKNNQDPIYIIAMIAWNLRQLVLVAYMQDKGVTQSEMCSKLRIPPFKIYGLMASAKRLGYDKICLLYEKISSLDYEIKTGGIDGKLGLSLLQTAF